MNLRALSAEYGQASVELLGVLPAIVLICAVGWVGATAGQARWLTGSAARAAARAEAIGRSPAAAARGALPDRLHDGLKVQSVDDGRSIRVTVRLPRSLGFSLGTVTASAHMAAQR